MEVPEKVKKDTSIAVSVEKAVAEAVGALARAEGMSNSRYVRRLIIEDLTRRDLLPSTTLERMLI